MLHTFFHVVLVLHIEMTYNICNLHISKNYTPLKAVSSNYYLNQNYQFQSSRACWNSI